MLWRRQQGTGEFLFTAEKTKLGRRLSRLITIQVEPSLWLKLYLSKSLYFSPCAQQQRSLTIREVPFSPLIASPVTTIIHIFPQLLAHRHSLLSGRVNAPGQRSAAQHWCLLRRGFSPSLISTDASLLQVPRTTGILAWVLLERKTEKLNWSFIFQSRKFCKQLQEKFSYFVAVTNCIAVFLVMFLVRSSRVTSGKPCWSC